MNFDTKAQEWDNDKQRVERAAVFAKEINDFLQPNGKINALEFGCGTGLLSFNLKNYFKTIFLVDTSKGMIDVLKEKIKKESIRNFIPIQMDIFEHKNQFRNIDVIYTLMTLHHILDIEQIFKKFNAILEMNGYLCIADLVKEDGSFHSNHKNFDGHNGFDKVELSEMLVKNGFELKYYTECFEIDKIENEKTIKYPLFLMICKKVN